MKKILFVGGGTLGPVTPLLATVQALRGLEPRLSFEWIGTPSGPERILVQNANIPFHPLTVAKLPRYASTQWLTFPFLWAKARLEAKKLISMIKPDIVVTVGGFTAFPVVYAASAKKIPCITHQLDVEPLRTNLAIAKKCTAITTSFAYEKSPFDVDVPIERIATPVRFTLQDLPSRKQAADVFGMDPDRPTIFIFGGGTGAQALNDFVDKNLERLLAFAQILHVTGPNKGSPKLLAPRPDYFSRSFLDKHMLEAYACSDLVIARAGIGTMSELSALQKAAILVPIPTLHQQANASVAEKAAAAIVLDQTSPTFDDELVHACHQLLSDAEERLSMSRRWQDVLPTDDGTAFAKKILSILS